MQLKAFLKSMTVADRRSFAERCETTLGHLSNVAYGSRTCSPELAVALDRESHGRVAVEESCPSVDWAYLRRASTKSPLRSTTRKVG